MQQIQIQNLFQKVQQENSKMVKMNHQILINKLASYNSGFQETPTQVKTCKMMVETLGVGQLKLLRFTSASSTNAWFSIAMLVWSKECKQKNKVIKCRVKSTSRPFWKRSMSKNTWCWTMPMVFDDTNHTNLTYPIGLLPFQRSPHQCFPSGSDAEGGLWATHEDAIRFGVQDLHLAEM